MTPLMSLVLSWTGGSVLLALDGSRRWIANLAVLCLVVVALLDISFLLLFASRALEDSTLELISGQWPQGVGIRLRVDTLSLFFASITATVLAVTMYHETRVRVESRSFPGLLLLMCAGLHGAFFTGDLFNFYVFFELAIVTSFGLAAYGYGRAESRGTFIYMTVNVLGSVLFLIGVASIYHVSGTLDMAQLSGITALGSTDVMLACALLVTALGLKLGLFPFHAWVPVVYSHARLPVAASLAGALVNIGAYGLLRIGWGVFPYATLEGRTILLILGALATVYGSVVAISRKNAAELVAYTAIAQAGYILMSLSIGGIAGISATLLIVLSGSLEKTMMFLALDTHGRARRACALTGAISLAGLPLTVGFIGKVQLFNSLLAPEVTPLALGALLLSTPFTMTAAFRYWQLATVDADSATPTGAHLLLLLPLIAVGLALAPEGLAGLVQRTSAQLLGVGP